MRLSLFSCSKESKMQQQTLKKDWRRKENLVEREALKQTWEHVQAEWRERHKQDLIERQTRRLRAEAVLGQLTAEERQDVELYFADRVLESITSETH
jgi:hypothetical protein